MRKREYEWFLEPKDSHTNKVISSNIGEENVLENIVCADGQKHNLWRCLSGMRDMLWFSRGDLNIRFSIFGREGKNAKPKDLTFLFKNEGGSGKKRRKRERKVYHGRF